MKEILLALSLTVATLSFGVAAQSQTIASCETVENFPSENFIYKNSASLRVGGPGTPLTGFRRQPTLIMNKFYSRSGIKVYDSQDNLLGTCPWVIANEHSGGRFRCANSTALMRRKAIKNTGSPTLYFVTNPRTKSCFRVQTAPTKPSRPSAGGGVALPPSQVAAPTTPSRPSAGGGDALLPPSQIAPN
jgi:hypothetical protein